MGSNNRHFKSPSPEKMALRFGSSMLLRSMRSQAFNNSRAMSQMAFTFAAPNGVHYNAASVKQIDVPSFSGSFGILPNHVPALAVLSPGVVTVYEDGGDTNKFFVSSGSITVNEDSSIQILAEEAHKLESLDINAARQALTAAQSAASSAGDEVARAEAQIEVEVCEALVKALE